MPKQTSLAILRRTMEELRSKGFDFGPISSQRKELCSQADLSFDPAEFFAGDSYLRAAESALRRMRCLPKLAAALAWLKATSPQRARDLNDWLDRLAFYAEQCIPLAEFQQHLDLWMEAHQLVVGAYQAAVTAPASPPSGAADADVDPHGQLRLWSVKDFAPPASGQVVQKQVSSGDRGSKVQNENSRLRIDR
ncbi:MAG: hypothetical protein V3S55_01020 [Nitrospiraceae bacterium]